jgi:hypothetical protein
MAVTFRSTTKAVPAGITTNLTVSSMLANDLLIGQVSGNAVLPSGFSILHQDIRGSIGYRVVPSSEVPSFAYTFTGTTVGSSSVAGDALSIHNFRGVFIDQGLPAIDTIGVTNKSQFVPNGVSTAITWNYDILPILSLNELIFIVTNHFHKTNLSNVVLQWAAGQNILTGSPIGTVVNSGQSQFGHEITEGWTSIPSILTVGAYVGSGLTELINGANETVTSTSYLIPLSAVALVTTPVTESFNFAGGIGYRRRRRPFNPGSIDII